MIFSAFERMVAWRYLGSRRKERFVSVIAGFSFAGIMLGVATLIIVMSVMNGFRTELLDRVMGVNAHMVQLRRPARSLLPGPAGPAGGGAGRDLCRADGGRPGHGLGGAEPEQRRGRPRPFRGGDPQPADHRLQHHRGQSLGLWRGRQRNRDRRAAGGEARSARGLQTQAAVARNQCEPVRLRAAHQDVRDCRCLQRRHVRVRLRLRLYPAPDGATPVRNRRGRLRHRVAAGKPEWAQCAPPSARRSRPARPCG